MEAILYARRINLESNVSIVPIQVAVYLDAAIFPCSPREMFCCADANNAPEHVLDLIESLPIQQYCHVRKSKNN
jgi:hypothetical protein